MRKDKSLTFVIDCQGCKIAMELYTEDADEIIGVDCAVVKCKECGYVNRVKGFDR